MGLYLRTEWNIQIPASGLVGLKSAQTADRAFAVPIFLPCHMMKGHMIMSVCLSGISQEISRISFAEGDFFSQSGNYICTA